MKKNIGKTDRVIRILLGILIVITGTYFNSVWGVLGMVPIITSQLEVCPLYSLLHISTISKQEKRKES